MNTQLDDQHLADTLRSGFAGATYDRSSASLRPASRAPFLGGMAVAATAAVTGLLLATTGGSSPALAWSPTPVVATEADEAAARAACTVDPAAGAEGREPAAPVDVTPVDSMPAELPPLVAFDLRGTGGLATFADAQWTATCLVVRSGDGFERGPVVLEPTTPAAEGALAVSWASGTTWQDGREISMVSGVAPAGATTVEVNVRGQPTASANVVDGRFNLWWIGSLPVDGGSIRALDGSGVELAAAAPLIAARAQ